MGGYGSGRRKTHHITYDCLSIDTMQLRKHKLLTSKKLSTGSHIKYVSQSKSVKEKVIEQHHELYVLVERYAPGNPPGELAKWDAIGHVTLLYGVKVGGEDKGKQHAELPLVVTHPNYGGVRYWFLAPCCGRRVRVVYLPTFDGAARMLPECRECLGLHYASQQQSYIDRHITYEKYLLANAGYTWANWEYNWELKEHYFTVTPEWEYIRQESILKRELELLRHLISFERMMLRTHQHNLLSLKSEEDRRVYIEHLVKEHGQDYALDLVRLLKISIQVERDGRETSPEVFKRSTEIFERLYMLEAEADCETPEEPTSLQNLFERKKELQAELKQLQSAA